MGAMYGKYEVLGRLGIGGMGVVYLARDTVLGRKVALKLLDPRLVAEEDRLSKRFLHEARVSAALSHPNIVTLYDFGEEHGQSYIAMEYLQGDNLRTYIDRRVPLSLVQKLHVAIHVAQGLDYAHRSGVIHRDIKPGNIQVLPRGEVKLMDFGIAKLAETSMTQTGVTVGTPGYSSPEQIKSAAITPASDVFSYGIVLYEWLTYRRAFQAENTMALLFKIVYEDAAPFKPEDEVIPPSLRGLVFRCIAKKSENRFGSFAPVVEELRRIQQVVADQEGLDSVDREIARAPWLPGKTEVEPLPSGAFVSEKLSPERLAAIAAANASQPTSTPSPAPVMPTPSIEAPVPAFPAVQPTPTDPVTLAIPAYAEARDRSRPTMPVPQQEPAASTRPPAAPLAAAPAAPSSRLPALAGALAGVAITALAAYALDLLPGSPAPPVRSPTPVVAASPAPSFPPERVQTTPAGSAAVLPPPSLPTESPTAPLPSPTLEPLPPTQPPPTRPPSPTPRTPPTPRPTNTPVPRPTAPPPTDTPRPSPTRVPPTNTPLPAPTRVPPTAAPVAEASDEDKIRSVLGRYRQAYESLDAKAVQRIWPSLSFRQLDRLQAVFSTYESQSVEIRDPQISVKGDKATVKARVRRVISPKVGEKVSDERATTFQLRRNAGGAWVIEDIR